MGGRLNAAFSFAAFDARMAPHPTRRKTDRPVYSTRAEFRAAIAAAVDDVLIDERAQHDVEQFESRR